MNRRSLLKLFGLAPLFGVVACADAKDPAPSAALPGKLSHAEWKKILPPESYRVLFEEATERPGTSPLNAEKRAGVFVCAACYNPLFDSDKKYESGTGWPSFFKPRDGALGTKVDRSLFSERTEYHCAHCGGHQGHVFDDGPAPTGLRYCNNGVALRFIAKGEALPALRA
ncbi:MAG: peptide-methionine (R)-S-oxide reductase MsrB [Pseudomonadota bacterium]